MGIRFGTRCAAVVSLCYAVGMLVAPTAAGQGPGAQVTYTVSVDAPTTMSIYYRQTDPPDLAAYSHDPYRYSPKDVVELYPGQPWVLHTTLTDPRRWSMVVARASMAGAGANVSCTLTVDAVVMSSETGTGGVLCSMRVW